MDSLIATVTDAGVGILNDELFYSIKKFSLVNIENERYYTDDIHSLMFDNNGILTATITIPKADNFDTWNNEVFLETVEGVVICKVQTPKIKFLAGIGGVQEVKISVSGTASEIIFKKDDYITLNEAKELFAELDHNHDEDYAFINGSETKTFKVKNATGSKEAINKGQLDTAFSNFVPIPRGVITMWSGSISSIPAGWFLCNGGNGTPDLRNKFVYGASANADVGVTGGSADAVVVSHNHSASSNSTGAHTHTANHNHSASSNSTGNHTHTANHNHSASSNTTGSHSHYHNQMSWNTGVTNQGITSGTTDNGTNIYSNSAGSHSHSITVNTASVTTSSTGAHSHSITVATKSLTTSSTGSHSHSITVGSSGVSGTGKNLPPYMKLAYIMKG